MTGNLDALADIVLARCDRLGHCSDEPGQLTRTFLGPGTRQAHDLLAEWMRQAGLSVRVDAVGNMIGRRAGRDARTRVFGVGSHIDTVPNAGKYDGVLGVLLAIAAAEALDAGGATLDVIAFSEEEGVRFRKPFFGSRAVCGQFDESLLQLRDEDGVTVEQAIGAFGLDPAAIPMAAYPPGQLAGYLEVHIEQGPVLENRGLPLGIVAGIAGQSRYSLTFTGHAGHAGTQPMELRRDALVAAAEFVTTVAQIARQTDGLRATVGRLQVIPNAVNVVPGQVLLSLDVRHIEDETRHGGAQTLANFARRIGFERKTDVIVEQTMDVPAVASSKTLTERLANAVVAAGHEPFNLVSGAGHDAAVMAGQCPIAMLFVRSPGGISHHPDESVLRDDVRAALDVMIRFLSQELTREN